MKTPLSPPPEPEEILANSPDTNHCHVNIKTLNLQFMHAKGTANSVQRAPQSTKKRTIKPNF